MIAIGLFTRRYGFKRYLNLLGIAKDFLYKKCEAEEDEDYIPKLTIGNRS